MGLNGFTGVESGNREESKKLYEDALSLSQAAVDSQHISACYTGLGNIYFDEQNYEKALYYYKESLAIDRARKSYSGIAKSYINIGNIQHQTDMFSSAQQYYRDAASFGWDFRRLEAEGKLKSDMAE